jgi:hypothetical protein
VKGIYWKYQKLNCFIAYKKLVTKKHILTTKHFNNKVRGSTGKYFKIYSGFYSYTSQWVMTCDFGFVEENVIRDW